MFFLQSFLPRFCHIEKTQTFNEKEVYLGRLRLWLSRGVQSEPDFQALGNFHKASFPEGESQDPPAAPQASSFAKDANCGVSLRRVWEERKRGSLPAAGEPLQVGDFSLQEKRRILKVTRRFIIT